MTPNLLDPILEGVYTQTDSLRRLRLLKEQMVLTVFGNPAAPIDPTDLPDDEKTWLNKMSSTINPNISKNNLYQVFNNLEKEIRAIEPLAIFIPFEMPKDEVTRLGIYLRQMYGKNFLMELKFDPKLIAGAALSWKGIYKDYSLHQRILDNQTQILQTLKQYIKHG